MEQRGQNDSGQGNFSMGIHPQYIVVALILFAISAMFLSCSAAYVYTRIEHGVAPLKLPGIFPFNTLLLVASTISLKWAANAYKKDQTQDYKTALLTTLLLSILFLLGQLFGWKKLFELNQHIQDNNSAAYLYLISGLHFLHVIAGLPFLTKFYLSARKYMVEPVSVLIYFSDSSRRLRLQLLTWYWRFLDILWIYLVVFFLINSWI